MKTIGSKDHATAHDVTEKSFMSAAEAAQLMGKSEAYVIKLIQRGSLCGRKDKKTRKWLAEAACVQTQLQSPAATAHGAGIDGIIDYEIPEDAVADLAETFELSPFAYEEDERQVWYAGSIGQDWSRAAATESSVREVEAAVFDQSEVQTLITDLAIARHRLEGTLIRVGYLEAQVDAFVDQLKLLPEYRTRAAHSIILRKENEDLRAIIDDRNAQIVERDRELINKDQLIETIRTAWWYRLYCFVWGKKPL